MQAITSIHHSDSQSFAYFKSQQKSLIENFANSLTTGFQSAGVKFGEEYDNFIGSYLENKTDIYNEKMKKLEMLYRMYCLLHGQVKFLKNLFS
jgi:hypothetical protein